MCRIMLKMEKSHFYRLISNGICPVRGSAVMVVLLLLSFHQGFSQKPTDHIFVPKHYLVPDISFELANFKNYWEVKYLRDNQTVGKVMRTEVRPTLTYGITDRMNVYASLPFIQKESKKPNGGFLDEAHGMQDLSLAVKYQVLEKNINDNRFSVSSALGLSFRPTKYSSDLGFYNLGTGAPELSIRGIAAYTLKNNIYFRGGGAYLLHGRAKTYADSYFYINDVVYSSKMYVPDAVHIEAATGLWALKNKLRVELNYSGYKSLGGDSIRSYTSPKPTNRVNYDKIEALAQYFISHNIGIKAHYSTVVNGLNTPQWNAFGGGIVFKFNVK